jgi:hypothetical protein
MMRRDDASLDALIIDDAFEDSRPRGKSRPRAAARPTVGQLLAMALVVGACLLAMVAGVVLHPLRTWHLLRDQGRGA